LIGKVEDKTDGWDGVSADKTRLIIGCAMEVLNGLGHGLLEKVYENALLVEFESRQIPCMQQTHFEVFYKGRRVGEYVPDILAFGEIVVEVKVVDCLTDHEIGQVLNYLRIAKLQVGLLLNFRRARLEWKRIIL
jgi:GxxExxY protein